MKLSDIIREPVVTSPFGAIRPFSSIPHKGIDVVSKDGERFVRAPAAGRVIWQWNVTSRGPRWSERIRTAAGVEWPLGWYYSDVFGMIASWVSEEQGIVLSFAHLEPFQTSDIAQRQGCVLWELRTRHQRAYDEWCEWYGNVQKPVTVQKGELLGVYSDVGSAMGAHTHIELRYMRLDRERKSNWVPVDPLTVIEEA